MKIYFAKLTTNNLSANRILGIFTEDKLAELEREWKEIEAVDRKSEDPYYGDCIIESVEYELNEKQ